MFTLEKLNARIPQIVAAAVRATQPLGHVMTCRPPGPVDDSAMASAPTADDPLWQPLHVGDRWGGLPGTDPDAPPRLLGWGIPADGGSTHWLRTTLRVPDAWRDEPVLLALHWTYTDQSSLEGIAYLDGKALAGIDDYHRAVLLPPSAHDGEHELLIRCYVPFVQPFGGLTLQLRDTTIFQLGHLLRAGVEAIATLPNNDPARHTLLQRLNNAYNTLDLRDGFGSEQFAASARTALDQLRPGLRRDLQPSQRPTLLSTGHAHLDVAWLWPLWRTRQKVAHTVATALHLMDRYPDYHFSMSQPQVYAYLKHDDPALYARMQQRIREGRFEPVGMMWIEPDCNIPSGESLVRQMVHGARFFADEFGVQNHVVWLPDVFGYSAALPQIMRGCGVRTFMTTKISWNQVNRMPNDTFRWRGIDGSEVLTHFVTATDAPVRHPTDAQFYTYVGHMTGGEVAGTWNHYRQKAINTELLYIYGWGDGGGGPTEDMLEAAALFADLPSLPQVKLGRANEYFDRLYARVWDDPQLPTWVGELYLEYHRGTYTSQARTKQHNRDAELLLREAEWLNAWAVTLGAVNQQRQLDHAWQSLLLQQFHDILPGSSVPLVYVDSNAHFAEIQRLAGEVRDTARAYVAQQAQNMQQPVSSSAFIPHPSSFTVWNSLPWDRHDVVRLPADQADAGSNSATQLIEENGAQTLLALADAPAYSASGLNLADRPAVAATLHTERSRLATDQIRLELDDNGEIAALRDLRHARDVIVPGSTANQLVTYEDRPLNWDAWDIDLFYEEKPYPVHEITDWRVVETGPIRSAVEITRQLGRSRITQRICVWAHMPRIDFVTAIDWQERQTLLRALFPLHINATRATCEIQFGVAERATHRNTSWDWARFEVCAQRWVDLHEGDYGVALLNTGKYGHSLHNTTLGVSLLKGAIHPDPDADRGLHRFTYSLLPHAGDWREGQVVRRAYELNVPLLAVGEQAVGNEHSIPATSFLRCASDHVVVETIKMAHDGDGLIVRLYETHNTRGPLTLTFGQPIRSAEEVDLLERSIGSAIVDGATLRCTVRPFEIKTFRVRLT